MPNPSWPSGRGRPGRRAVLGAGVAAGTTALLAGCGVRVGSPAGPATPAPAGPDELARERVARDADALLALVSQVAAARPADRALLRAVAADHRAHAAALRPSAASNSSSPAPPGPGSASTGVPSTGRPSTGPALAARDALPALARAERAAASAASAELERVSGEVARLLASVAASRSLHVALVTARLDAGSRPARAR